MTYKIDNKTIVKGLLLSCILLIASCGDDDVMDTDPTYAYEISPEAAVVDCKAQTVTINVTPKSIGGHQKKEWYIHEVQENGQDAPTYLDPRNKVSDYDGEWYQIKNVDYNNVQVTLTENASEISRSVKVGIQGSPMLTCYFTITQEGIKGEITFTLTARYKGKEYVTTAHSIGENITYDSEEFAQLNDYLGMRDDVETFINPDGSIDIYDSQDAVASRRFRNLTSEEQQAYSLLDIPVADSRSRLRSQANPWEGMNSTDKAFCAVWDDNTYHDSHIWMNIAASDNLYKLFEYPYLTSQGMNDKISSISMSYNLTDTNLCAIITVWEDSYYNNSDQGTTRSKHRTNFVATYSNSTPAWANLSQIPCIGSSNSWNDRISSLSFHIGYASSLPLAY